MKDPTKINVLVACEESQRVCMAFRDRGFNAFSCDIQECSGGHPEYHILGDAVKALDAGEITTMDGRTHSIPKWDLLIAHPPCTYLSNVATRAFSLRCTPPEKVVRRWEDRAKAAIFFMYFALADIPHKAIENPIGFMNTAYRKPNQIILPYMFSDGESDTENYTKKTTCLWTQNLPLLVPKCTDAPDLGKLYGKYSNGKNRTWEETRNTDRAKNRSKTFPGIAKAMAEQWGDYILQEDE